MRFAIGEAVVDVIVDHDNYALPLSGFLPGVDAKALAKHRAVLEPAFLDLAQGRLKVAVQSYVLRTGGRTILIDSCIGDARDRPQVPVWNQHRPRDLLRRRDALPGPDLPAGRLHCLRRRSLHRDREPSRDPGRSGRDRSRGGSGSFPRQTVHPDQARAQRVRAGISGRECVRRRDTRASGRIEPEQGRKAEGMDLGKRMLLRMFGRPKGLLGRLGGIMMARINRSFAQEIVALLDLRASEKVLEVGFGPGVGIELMAKAATSGRIAGIDPSAAMLKQAAARNAAAIGTGAVDLRHGDVASMPFEGHAFDTVLAINSMQVWPDPIAGSREIRRVLTAGGRVALAFTPNSGQPRAGVTDLLASAGFDGAHLVELRGGFCALARKP